MFTIRDLKPRGPRGCIKILKAARIDTRANLRDRFIVWEPLPNGKVKVRLSCTETPFDEKKTVSLQASCDCIHNQTTLKDSFTLTGCLNRLS